MSDVHISFTIGALAVFRVFASELPHHARITRRALGKSDRIECVATLEDARLLLDDLDFFGDQSMYGGDGWPNEDAHEGRACRVAALRVRAAIEREVNHGPKR